MSTGRPSDVGDDNLVLDVSVTFLTGVWADYSSLWLSSDGSLHSFALALAEATKMPWSSASGASDALVQSSVAQHSSSVSPDCLARCTLEEPYGESIAPLLQDIRSITDSDATVSLAMLVCTIQDYGIGSVLATLQINLNARAEDSLKHPDPVVISRIADLTSEALRSLIAFVTTCYTDVLAEKFSDTDRLEMIDRAVPGTSGITPGLPLWSHSLATWVGADAEAHPFRYELSDGPGKFVAGIAAEVMAFGYHRSFAFAESQGRRTQYAMLIDRLNSWWSATWAIDRELLLLVHEQDLRSRNAGSSALSSQAEFLATLALKIGLVRSRLSSYRINLSNEEWRLWNDGYRHWAVQDNVNSIVEKQELIQQTHVAVRSLVAEQHSRRLARIAAVITTVATVASAVTVFIFVFPELDSSADYLALRWGLLSISACATVLTIFWSSRAIRRLRQPSIGHLDSAFLRHRAHEPKR